MSPELETNLIGDYAASASGQGETWASKEIWKNQAGNHYTRGGIVAEEILTASLRPDSEFE